MKKLLILVDTIGPKKEHLAQFIAEKMPNNKVAIARFSDLIYEVDGKKVSVRIDSIDENIGNFDLVYFRRAGSRYAIPAGNLALCLSYLNIKFFDSAFSNIGPLGNKLTSYLKLSLAGLPTMPFFFCDSEKILDYKKHIIEKFGLPLVAKELSAQRGKGVFLVKSEEDFSKLPMKGGHGKNNEFLFQKFYKSDEEYRVLVLKDGIGAYERKIRTDPNEFRSNVAVGAREEFIDINKIPDDIKDISIRGAAALGIQVAGADVMVDDKGNKWLLEVNRGPGLTYDPKVSPELANLAKFFDRELQND